MRSEGSFLHPFAPHAFRNSVQQTLADRGRGFRSYVPRSDSGAASGDYNADLSGEANQQILNLDQVVGNDFADANYEAAFLESLGDSRAGEIFAFTTGTRVADGDDGSGNRGCRRGACRRTRLTRGWTPSAAEAAPFQNLS